MTEYEYPAHIVIDYNDDDEYRQSICRLFSKSLGQSPTEDAAYDDDEFYALIHYIETHTGYLPEFRTLYVAAAAHLMSEEVQVGIVVLLSYDYLVDFHILLCEHFTHADLDVSHADVSHTDVSHTDVSHSAIYQKILCAIRHHFTVNG